MKNLMSRLSMHDVVSILLPGLLYVLFMPLGFGRFTDYLLESGCLPEQMSSVKEFAGYVILLILAFGIGILNNLVNKLLWRGISRDYSLIKYCKDLTEEKKSEVSCVERFSYTFVQTIIVFIFASFFSLAMSDCNANSWIVNVVVFVGICTLFVWFVTSYTRNADYGMKGVYDEAYHKVLSNIRVNDLAVTEGYMRLLQNLLFPILILALYVNGNQYYAIKISLFIIVLAMILASVVLRASVYKMVWRESQFIKATDK